MNDYFFSTQRVDTKKIDYIKVQRQNRSPCPRTVPITALGQRATAFSPIIEMVGPVCSYDSPEIRPCVNGGIQLIPTNRRKIRDRQTMQLSLRPLCSDFSFSQIFDRQFRGISYPRVEIPSLCRINHFFHQSTEF
jgi:hypothetical protein